MASLLADVAQARRILGPVCRMLGVEIEGVRAPIPVVDRVQAERTRVKRARAVVDFGRIALPRGVLAAATRQGYGVRCLKKG